MEDDVIISEFPLWKKGQPHDGWTVRYSYGEFIDAMEKRSRTHHATHLKNHAGGWSPTRFEGNRRTKAKAIDVCAVGLDFDKSLPPEQVREAFIQYCGFVTTTKSHTPEKPRTRVVLMLDKPMLAKHYATLWTLLRDQAAQHGLEADEQCKDVSRFWFHPSRPIDGSTTYFQPLDGVKISVDKVVGAIECEEAEKGAAREAARAARSLRTTRPSGNAAGELYKRAQAYVATFEPAIQGENGSTTTFNAARKLHDWVRKGLGELDAMTLFAEYNARCVPPWSEKDLHKKWKDAENAEKPAVIEDRPAPQLSKLDSSRPSNDAETLIQSSTGSTTDEDQENENAGQSAAAYPEWHDRLEMHTTKDGIVVLDSVPANAITILSNDPKWRGTIAFNAFTSEIVTTQIPPWSVDEMPVGCRPGAWSDADTVRYVRIVRRDS